jgi:predicted ribosome quality control (RQC) complex YloA/Tae2 family protein
VDKNYYHIRELANFLNKRLPGYSIEEVFTQEKDKLVVALSKGGDVSYLEYSLAKNSEYLLLRDSFSKAKRNVAGLFGELTGMKAGNVSLFNDDRVICIKLDPGISILFSFIRGKYNCFISKDDVIINAFKERNEFLQKKIADVFPERSKNADNKAGTIKEYIKKNFAEYGSLYQKEVLFRTGLTEDDDLAGNEQLLNEEFASLNEELKSPVYLFYYKDSDVKTSLIELEHLKGYEKKELGDINSLIEYLNRFRYKEDKTKDVVDSKIKKLKKELEGVEGNISNLSNTIEEFKLAERHRIHGELILANLTFIHEGDEYLELDDPSGMGKVMIKLKEDLSPVENANYYYEKYKKQKNAIPEIEKKVKMFEREREKLSKEINELERVEDFKQVKKLEKEAKKEGKPDETSRFRKFVLDNKYEVWVGKDSKANDLLTTKYSAPHDLWFHVRGASGSHTVLKVAGKKDDVNKEAIKKAAAISAYYSKARSASMVPVAYCEKKFVKKPKGAKAGAVIMMREKVINVRPGLPDDLD